MSLLLFFLHHQLLSKDRKRKQKGEREREKEKKTLTGPRDDPGQQRRVGAREPGGRRLVDADDPARGGGRGAGAAEDDKVSLSLLLFLFRFFFSELSE